jgi:hypothetical protein
MKGGTMWQTAEKATFSLVYAAMSLTANTTGTTTGVLPTASMWNRQPHGAGLKRTAVLLCRVRRRKIKQYRIFHCHWHRGCFTAPSPILNAKKSVQKALDGCAHTVTLHAGVKAYFFSSQSFQRLRCFSTGYLFQPVDQIKTAVTGLFPKRVQNVLAEFERARR